MNARLLAVLAVGLSAGTAANCGDSGVGSEPRPLYAVAGGVPVDAAGHALFLRGINVRQDAKASPEHLLPLGPEQIAQIRDRGFNSVRLLTFWEAVAPAADAIDSDYLQRLAAEADALAAAGLYVVIDMHQDLWGRPFGDGAAAWTCPQEIRAGYQPQSPWWLNYNSEQVRGCFDRFWADADGIQDRWRAAWVAVAEAVCDQQRVIGFDLFNEPWPGSAIGDADFDQRVLLPFYRQAMAAIEAVCPERLFFLEPSAGFTFGIAEPMTIPAELADRVLQAPHYYPQLVHEPGQRYDWDAAQFEASFSNALGDQLAAASPVWIGEYGGHTDNPGIADYFVHFSDACFRGFIGSALWAYDRSDGGFAWLDADGRPKPVFAPAWSVPLPVRLPARPERMVPDFAAGALELACDCRPDREFELLLPAAGGWQVTFQPDTALQQRAPAGRRLVLACRRAGPVELSIQLAAP